ncbi:hypothetical protein L3Q82_004270 [Scortum barcoo]|uniref:Uncharacterized protein n=1 Tax=Scortum barcoo TaxID=214431 RepID=A0ACB8VJB9_9TELE|nr:hypothetical protein L3Q82_004270 [Scortum barcoo]
MLVNETFVFSSQNQRGRRSSERRFHGVIILLLGLLSVFMLAGLIGLAVHYHYSVRGSAAELSTIRANLTERLQESNTKLVSSIEERDQLKANLTEMTEELKRLQSLSKQNRTCPAGWRMLSCTCYFFSTTSASWEQSRRDCRDKGADLVVIESYEEQELLTKIIKKETWIGLNDREKEGVWKWIDETPLTQAADTQDICHTYKAMEEIYEDVGNETFVFSSQNQRGRRSSERRFHGVIILLLGLLSVFLLVWAHRPRCPLHVGTSPWCGAVLERQTGKVRELRRRRRQRQAGRAESPRRCGWRCRTGRVESWRRRIRKEDEESQTAKTCPAGWRMFDSACYFFSTTSASWEQSRRDCRDKGADLVVIESYEEQKFLTIFIKKETWIGLNDREKEDIWKWIDETPLTQATKPPGVITSPGWNTPTTPYPQLPGASHLFSEPMDPNLPCSRPTKRRSQSPQPTLRSSIVIGPGADSQDICHTYKAMGEIYVNVFSSWNQRGRRSSERRFHGVIILLLGLLSVFLLTGLIGLAVHFRGSAAELSTIRANLTERLQESNTKLVSAIEERDQLKANLD